jgi:hypothetical protein
LIKLLGPSLDCLIDVHIAENIFKISKIKRFSSDQMDSIDPNNPKFEAFQKAIRDALEKRLRDADEELARSEFIEKLWLELYKLFVHLTQTFFQN